MLRRKCTHISVGGGFLAWGFNQCLCSAFQGFKYSCKDFKITFNWTKRDQVMHAIELLGIEVVPCVREEMAKWEANDERDK